MRRSALFFSLLLTPAIALSQTPNDEAAETDDSLSKAKEPNEPPPEPSDPDGDAEASSGEKTEPKADAAEKTEPKADAAEKTEPKADAAEKAEPKADAAEKTEPKADETSVGETGMEASTEATDAGAASSDVELPDADAQPEEHSHTCGCADHAKSGGFGSGMFHISLDGYLRVEAGTFVPDRFFGFITPASTKRESLPGVGRVDGFGLGDARLNLRARYKDLYVRLGFDGAIATYASEEDVIGELGTGLKDAYMRYTFGRSLSLYVGRFKPPFDVEELTPTEAQFFVHRALESRGVWRHEGPLVNMLGRPDMQSFAPGRQIGLMAGSDGLFGSDGLDLGYAFAVTNGNSGDARFNDNDLPALWLRLFATWDNEDVEGVIGDEEGPATYSPTGGGMAGISLYYNELTTGLAPKRYRDRAFGGGVDLAVTQYVFHLQGQFLASILDPVNYDSAPMSLALGGHISLAVQIPGTGFFPAYRFAYLDPLTVSDDTFGIDNPDADRVMHHTIGVSYQAIELPLVFFLEYTRSIEEAANAQPNDRVEAAMQVTFQ